MRWVALSNAVNLFDRLAIMRQWGELGTFDLLAATKSLDTAANVHDCIGRLLAHLVMQGLAVEGEDKEKKLQSSCRAGVRLAGAARAGRGGAVCRRTLQAQDVRRCSAPLEAQQP